MMDIKIESLIPIERIKSDVDAVFQLVDKNNTVVVLKDNQPAYLIVKYVADADHLQESPAAGYEGSPDQAIKSGPQKRKAVSRKPRRAKKAASSAKGSATGSTGSSESPKYTLHEAVRMVLAETESKQMTAAEVAEEIYQRGLYRKRDGTMTKHSQLRARLINYPDLFEVLPGNIIKLKEEGVESPADVPINE